MINYARADTHYLLYVFDKMRNALLEKGPELMQAVLDRSRVICQKRYETPVAKDFEFAATQIIMQHTTGLTPTQARTLRDLLRWRDRRAVEKDIAPQTALSTHYLVRIVLLFFLCRCHEHGLNYQRSHRDFRV